MTTRVDVREKRCPMTWVLAKLALERAEPGETVEVLCAPGSEALENVPRSASWPVRRTGVPSPQSMRSFDGMTRTRTWSPFCSVVPASEYMAYGKPSMSSRPRWLLVSWYAASASRPAISVGIPGGANG